MKRDKSLSWQHQQVSSVDLHHKKIIVVGGTGGIGRAFARLMASRGAEVIVVGQTFRDSGTPGISFMQADLSSMIAAQKVAQELPAETTDAVIFTIGIMTAPKREETREGIERDLAVSFLSRFVMLREFASRLGRGLPKSSRKPRVFVVAYPGAGMVGDPDDLNAEKSYKQFPTHMNTVAGNEAMVLDAVKRYPNLGVYGLSPGLIKTNVRSNFFGENSLKHRLAEALIGLLTPTADSYAKRLLPVLFAPEIEEHSGALFNRKGEAILPTPKLNAVEIGKFMRGAEKLSAKAGVALQAA